MSIANKLTKIAENVPKVYEAGQKSEYDRFWDAYQNNGNRTSYSYAFAGTGWNDANLNPKHPIVCSGGLSYMFRDSSATYGDKIFEIDISQVSSGSGIFYNSRIKRIGVLDTRSLSDLNTMFQYNSNLTSIEKIILKDDGSQKFTATFSSCPKIEEIRFEGTIGKSLDIHWSTKLSAESYENIFKCMTVTVSGQTLTVPKSTAEATYNAKYGSGKWASRVNGIKALGWAVSYL